MAIPRLTADDVACWVLKTGADVAELAGAPEGEAVPLARCVHPTYRLGLVRPGQPVLLWRSGRQAGVRAVGQVLAAPAGGAVRVALRRLAEPVPRADLLADARFRAAEVVRVPMGANPSYLTAVQLAAVAERLAPAAGWPSPGGAGAAVP
ncbi:hypothetical protein MO973_36250 [Paenibacillus sp. TRM 82003]|uniref:hypothetical protein n=1 Tax=Kineococcus sp. TRM81007 TaxID=2925831 RepID=UPI001F5AA683|nr:hypothetical protein [Kineococcus sp. TRM81007]MCI2240029.1 hypothetical protein [Kineococcus sp. TRM81007]MCI3925665.1 hypothetical protein [Paenibacillus sp. TRM 82003]